jgi:nitroreductase
MDVSIAVRERRSIRSFLPKELPEEVIGELVDALRWAPSAGNLQSRKFYFVRDGNIRKRLAAAALNQRFIDTSGLVVVCCADARIGRHYGERGVALYSIQDVSASIMCMMLVAHEKGLGTCWVGAFREKEVSEILHLPDYLRPVALVPVGYPAKAPSRTSRVPAEEATVFV